MRWLGLMSALVVSLLGVGCRGSSGDDIDAHVSDGDGGPDASNGEDTPIYDIQTPGGPASTIGTPVTIRGVVVTAVDRFGNRTGNVFVQEPAGGAYSGVLVFGASVAGGTLDDLQPGDIVDIEGGQVDQFDCTPCGTPFPDAQTLTEVSPLTMGSLIITEVGAGQVPAAEVVDPSVLAADPAEAEKWEGVLIQMNNVAVVTAPRLNAGAPADQANMDITGPWQVASTLTALTGPAPDNMPLYMRDECFASIVGVGDYFYDFKVLPRDAADLTVAADMSNCLYEDSVAECHDSSDDDHDGFTDCADFSCQLADPAGCTSDTTIQDVQMGTVAVGSLVSLTDVIVTARASSLVWVEEAGGGPFSGVAVFPMMPPGMTLQPGTVVDVQGNVAEYFEVTEIENATITVTGTVPPVDPEDIADPSELTSAATAEQWEGVLVRVSDLRVSAVPDGFGEWTVGSFNLHIDDIMADPVPTPAVGDCYSEIVGPLHFSFSNYKIEPRSIADIVPGATCP
jgi:hypothetical protein